jgi:hypothetical protein
MYVDKKLALYLIRRSGVGLLSGHERLDGGHDAVDEAAQVVLDLDVQLRTVFSPFFEEIFFLKFTQ